MQRYAKLPGLHRRKQCQGCSKFLKFAQKTFHRFVETLHKTSNLAWKFPLPPFENGLHNTQMHCVHDVAREGFYRIKSLYPLPWWSTLVIRRTMSRAISCISATRRLLIVKSLSVVYSNSDDGASVTPHEGQMATPISCMREQIIHRDRFTFWVHNPIGLKVNEHLMIAFRLIFIWDIYWGVKMQLLFLRWPLEPQHIGRTDSHKEKITCSEFIVCGAKKTPPTT